MEIADGFCYDEYLEILQAGEIPVCVALLDTEGERAVMTSSFRAEVDNWDEVSTPAMLRALVKMIHMSHDKVRSFGCTPLDDR